MKMINERKSYSFTARCDIRDMAVCADYIGKDFDMTRSGVIASIVSAVAQMIIAAEPIQYPTVEEAYDILTKLGMINERSIPKATKTLLKLSTEKANIGEQISLAKVIMEDREKNPSLYDTPEKVNIRIAELKDKALHKILENI